MKNKALIFISLLSLSCLTGCFNSGGGSQNPPEEPTTYQAIWKNYDGSVLKTDTVKEGETPRYNGETPTKPNDYEFSYTFYGWEPNPSPIYQDTTYVAQYYSDDLTDGTFLFRYQEELNAYYVSNLKNEARVLKTLIIPSSFNDLPVIGISSSMCAYNEVVERVIIPDSIQYIEQEAFYSCKNLKYVEIGTGIKSIAERVFYCDLDTLILNSLVSTEDILSSYLLYYTREVYFGDCFTHIPDRYFEGSSLESIHLPETCRTLGDRAFSNGRLKEVILPDNVTFIGDYCFSSNVNLYSITLGKNLTHIGQHCFENDRNLIEVIDLTDIKITNNKIYDSSFYTLDGANDFENTFINAYQRNTIYNKEDSKIYTDENGLCFYKDGDYLAYLGCKNPNLLELVIPEGVTDMRSRNEYFEKITLPNSLKRFTGCFNSPWEAFNAYDNGLYLGNKDNPYMVLAVVSLHNISFKIHKDCKIIGDLSLYRVNYPYEETIDEFEIPEGVEVIESLSISLPVNKLTIPSTITLIDYICFTDVTNLYWNPINYEKKTPTRVSANYLENKCTNFYIGEGAKFIDSFFFLDIENLYVPHSLEDIALPRGSRINNLYWNTDMFVPDGIRINNLYYGEDVRVINNSSASHVYLNDNATIFYNVKNASLTEYNGIYYTGSENNPYLFALYLDDDYEGKYILHDDCVYTSMSSSWHIKDENFTISSGGRYIGKGDNPYYYLYCCFGDEVVVAKDCYAIGDFEMDNVVFPVTNTHFLFEDDCVYSLDKSHLYQVNTDKETFEFDEKVVTISKNAIKESSPIKKIVVKHDHPLFDVATAVENYDAIEELEFDTRVNGGDYSRFTNVKKCIFGPHAKDIFVEGYKGFGDTEIEISEDNPDYEILDNGVITYKKHTIIYVPSSIKGALVIPEGIVKLETFAPIDNNGITSIFFPSTFRYGCWDDLQKSDSIVRVNVSEKNPYIYAKNNIVYEKGYDFLWIPNTIRGEVYLEEGAELIGGIINPNITSLSLPSTVQYLAISDAMTGLETVIMRGKTFEYDDSEGSGPLPSNVRELIYINGIEGYLTVKNKNELTTPLYIKDGEEEVTVFNPLPGMTELKEYEFSYCYSFTELNITGDISTIGKGAFKDCRHVKSITVGKNVTSIGNFAFYDIPITSITYQGTMAEWSNITIGQYWKNLSNIKYVNCSDGTVSV